MTEEEDNVDGDDENNGPGWSQLNDTAKNAINPVMAGTTITPSK
jgi:hypothetical protein